MLMFTGEALSVSARAQQTNKPTVKLSEVKQRVKELVDNLSRDAKEHGVEVSEDQKNEMVNNILSKMRDQGTYAFIDP
jgi:2-phosphoglycerate kinase